MCVSYCLGRLFRAHFKNSKIKKGLGNFFYGVACASVTG